MRYIFVSDIHGQLDKLKTALNEVAFDKDKDTLVSLGDPFDRGPDSLGVLKFLMDCPNRVLVWGNHDLRLREIFMSGSVYKYDYQNGVRETMHSFLGTEKLNDIAIMINVFKTDDRFKNRLRLLYQYFDECVFAIEFNDLIGTHAWIPVLIDNKKTKIDQWGNLMTQIYYRYANDWREAVYEYWQEAVWSHSKNLYDQGIFEPNKKMIIGHWHAWRFRIPNIVPSDFNINDVANDTFETDNFVAIDGCSNAPKGKVNAWVYESEETPLLIEPGNISRYAAKIVA